MASGVSEAVLKRYRIVFESLDTDGSGTITADEVAQAMQTLGRDDNANLIGDLLQASNEEGLTFEQFVKLMETKVDEVPNDDSSSDDDDEDDDLDPLKFISPDEAKLYKRLFDELDLNRTGKLTTDSIHEHIRNLSLRGERVSEEELQFYFALVEAADASPEKGLTIEGMLILAQSHPDFIMQYEERILDQVRTSSFRRPLSTMASQTSIDLESDEVKEFRIVFDQLDADGDGHINVDELNAAMDKLGRRPTEEESEFIFTLLQMVGEEGLTFDQFVMIMLESSETIAQLGKSISTWKVKQSHHEAVQTKQTIKANISRYGLVQSISRADERISRREDDRLQRLNLQLQKNDSRYDERTVAALPPAKLTQIELRRYQAVFNALDKDGDGEITTKEFGETIKSVIGRQPSQEELSAFLNKADTDHSGTMNFEEFVEIMLQTKRDVDAKKARQQTLDPSLAEEAAKRLIEKYKKIFDRFDQNKDGKVTPEELRSVLRSLGKNVPESACKALIDTVDQNKDKAMEFDEFVALMQTKKIPKRASVAGKAMAEGALVFANEID